MIMPVMYYESTNSALVYPSALPKSLQEPPSLPAPVQSGLDPLVRIPANIALGSEFCSEVKEEFEIADSRGETARPLV